MRRTSEYDGYKLCGICGRDNMWELKQQGDDDWPSEDVCPNCEANEAYLAKTDPAVGTQDV